MKYLVAISFLLIAMLTACNPAKRAAKQQKQFQQMVDEYIKDHPPRIDTVTKYITGKDSSQFYKRIADSVAASKIQKVVDVRVKYKDTCTTAIQIFNEAYETGYQQGFAEGKLKAPVRVDTVLKTIVPTDQIALWQRQADYWERKYYEQSITLEKTKRQKNNFMWLFIAADVFIVLLTILTLKKLFRP